MGLIPLNVLFLLFFHWSVVIESKREGVCTDECPDGLYETHPCTSYSDKICSECTKCDESSYEIKPCTSRHNRQCLHATYRNVNSHSDNVTLLPSSLEGLWVEMSDNVVAEDLHNTRNLETTYYVTDMTQASDFYWDRESGIRVNIGIMNVHLIPEYEDVDHESDNSYMLSNPNNSEDKAKFQNILRQFCRNPIPDYYSITLEISRDRTTTAQHIRCDSKDASVAECPPSFNDGDKYLHRDLNEACQKMGTFPELLRSAANSFICTQRTALLEELFNQTYNAEKPIRFPTKKCRMAISRCEQCLNQLRCVLLDLFERKCCQVECYTLIDCKLAYSDECTVAPIECAMGDAHRFTIQPVFYNMRSDVTCHLHRRPLRVIYELFYFVQIPDRQFQTPKVRRTIYSTSDLAYQSRGVYATDYLTVEHDTGLELHDEMVLRQQEWRNRVNYTIHEMRTYDEEEEEEEQRRPHRRRIPIHEISHNIFVASTQFERPFDYSTSSWVQENGCHKNVSKIQTVHKFYDADRSSQDVNVIVQTSTTEPFRYFFKSVASPPYIRFTVPGNMSILPYYFRNDSPVLLLDESLSVRLDIEDSGRAWKINISGEVTDCPAYVGVTIKNLVELEEVFRYDLLVLCPVVFNLTFHVPNLVEETPEDDAMFSVQFTDVEKTHVVRLLHVTLKQRTSTDATRRLAEAEFTVTSSTTTRDADAIVVVNLTALLLLFLVVCFVVSFGCLENEKLRLRPVTSRSYFCDRRHRRLYGDRDAVFHGRRRGRSSSADVVRHEVPLRRTKRTRRRYVVGAYVVLWSVYSVSFTITVFFSIVTFLVRPETELVSSIDGFESGWTDATLNASSSMTSFWADAIRGQESLVGGMQRACTSYVGGLYARTASQFVGSILGQRATTFSVENDPDPFPHNNNNNVSISRLMKKRFEAQLESYNDLVRNYSHEFKAAVVGSAIQRLMARYRKYLGAVLRSAWLSFPLRVFNESDRVARRVESLEMKLDFAGDEVDFGMFLEVDEVEAVQLWSVQLWERYDAELPLFPDVPTDTLGGKELNCIASRSRSRSNATTIHDPLHAFDSTRFHVSLLPSDEESFEPPPKTSDALAAERFRRRSSNDREKDLTKTFKIDDVFRDDVVFDVVHVIFLVVDVLMLVYRISAIYDACKTLDDSANRNSGSSRRGDGSSAAVNGSVNRTPLRRFEFDAEERRLAAADERQNRECVRRLILNTENQEVSCLPAAGIEETACRSAAAAAALDVQSSKITELTATLNRCSLERITRSLNRERLPPSSDTMKNVSRFEVVWTVVAKVFQNDVQPRILIGFMFVVLVYASVRSFLVALDVDAVKDWNVLSTYVDSVGLRINQTNAYLSDDAVHMNDVVVKLYESHMQTELLNLQSLIEYLKKEQLLMVANFVSEACGVQKNKKHSHWTCNTTKELPKLEISLTPCSFVPLQPVLYPDFHIDVFENQLRLLLQPYIAATRWLVIKTTCAVAIAIAILLIVHTTSFVMVCQNEKTRHDVWINGSSSSSRCSADGAANVVRLRNDSEDDDDDDDDNDNDTRHDNYATFYCRHGSSVVLPATTVIHELKYIETKV